MVFLDMLEEMEVAEYNEAGAVRQDLRVIDPLVQLTNEEFRRIYRLTKHLFNFLVQIIEPFMTPKVRNTDLIINEKLLAALRFFATGSYQHDIGQSWYLGMSQPSVSRCIHEVIDALNQHEILNRFVKFPQNRQELDAVRLKFFQRYNMAGVIGCIDCTHIAIFTPHIDDPDYPEHLYANRKHSHSINIQFICDTDLKILSVNGRYPGNTHDAFIEKKLFMKNSNVYAQLQNLHHNGHTDYLLLGNSGYPLRSWLITPLEEEPPVNTPEHRFNNMENIRPLTNELQIKATEELNERPNHMRDDVDHIRNWVAKQPHLTARTDDQLLVSFLRGCKFSLERAKEKIDTYYSLRTTMPEYFNNRDPFCTSIQRILKSGCLVKLPRNTNAVSPTVYLFRWSVCDAEQMSFTDILKYAFMIYDIYLNEDDNGIVSGVQVVSDFSNFPVSYALQITPTAMRKLFICLQNAYPIRIKGFLMINTSTIFETIYSLIKPVMSNKLKNRVFIYGTDHLNDLYEILPKNIMPIEYGGENISIEKIVAETNKKVESYKEWFLEDAQYRTNEALRSGEQIFSTGALDMHGSFRKLDID